MEQYRTSLPPFSKGVGLARDAVEEGKGVGGIAASPVETVGQYSKLTFAYCFAMV